jgi:type 1 glutamine amidotransferase
MKKLFLFAFFLTLLTSCSNASKSTLSKNIHITIAWTKRDHPKGTHCYQDFATKWKSFYEQIEGVKVDCIKGYPAEEQWKKSDLVILYMTNRQHNKNMNDMMKRHLERGASVMLLHQALVVYKGDYQGWADNLGYAYQLTEKQKSKYQSLKMNVNFNNKHPITKDLKQNTTINDELYWELAKGTKGKTTVLASTKHKNKNWPIFWVTEHGDKQEKGRVFVSVIGHYATLFEKPFFHNSLLKASAWTLRQPYKPFKKIEIE